MKTKNENKYCANTVRVWKDDTMHIASLVLDILSLVVAAIAVKIFASSIKKSHIKLSLRCTSLLKKDRSK